MQLALSLSSTVKICKDVSVFRPKLGENLHQSDFELDLSVRFDWNK